MLRNVLVTLATAATMVAIIAPIVYFSHKNSTECDEVIFLEGENSRDIRGVNYIYDGNITRIYYCDDTIEDVPTSRVIKVIKKEDVQ